MPAVTSTVTVTHDVTVTVPADGGGGGVGAVGAALPLIQLEPLRDPYREYQGSVEMDGRLFPNSYVVGFSNCSNCTEEVEYNLSRDFTRFTATVGLTDDSNIYGDIDGRVEFSVFADGVYGVLPRLPDFS